MWLSFNSDGSYICNICSQEIEDGETAHQSSSDGEVICNCCYYED